jgi:hypothetical protein
MHPLHGLEAGVLLPLSCPLGRPIDRCVKGRREHMGQARAQMCVASSILLTVWLSDLQRMSVRTAGHPQTTLATLPLQQT